MKKLLLLSAVLLGAVSASQAGVRFRLGLPLPPLPLPPLPGIVAPAGPAYVAPGPAYGYGYSAPYYGYPAPYVAPPVIGFGFGNYYGHPYRGGGRWGGHWGGGHWGGGFRGHRR
jgi:hypothetical protein